MSVAEKVVTSAETLVAAVADSGIEQIVVSGLDRCAADTAGARTIVARRR